MLGKNATILYKIIATDQASAALALVGKRMLGVDIQANKLTGSMNRLKVAAGGALALVAGVGVLKSMAPILEAGNKRIQQENAMIMKGWERVRIAKAEAAAWETTNKILNTSVTQNMAAYQHMRAALFSDADTQRLLPTVQMMTSVIRAGKRTNGDEVSDVQARNMAFEVIRAGEFSGLASDMQRMERVIGGWTSAMVASNFQVGPEDFMAAAKFTRGAANTMDDNMLVHVLPTLISDLKNVTGGASQAGTAIKWAQKLLVSGRGDQKSEKAMVKWGLAAPDGIEYNKAGQIIGIKAGGVMGSDIAQRNLYDYFSQVYLPQIAKRGVDINDENAVARVNAEIFGGNAIMKMMADMLTLPENRARFVRDKDAQLGVMKLEDAQKLLMRKDLGTAKDAAAMQWDNVKAEMGKALMPMVVPLIAKFAEGLNVIANVFKQHPLLPRTLMIVAVAVGVALTALGAAALAAAVVFAAPFVIAGAKIMAVTAVVVAAGMFLLAKWDWIKLKFWEGVAAFGDVITKVQTFLHDKFGWFGDELFKAADRMLGGLLTAISSAKEKAREEADRLHNEQVRADRESRGIKGGGATGTWGDAPPTASAPPKRNMSNGNTQVNVNADGHRLASFVMDSAGTILNSRGVTGVSVSNGSLGGPLPLQA